MNSAKNVAIAPPISEMAIMLATPGLASPNTAAAICDEMATSVNTGMPSRATMAKSSRAARWGEAVGAMMPRWSLLASRLESTLPRAPVSSRNGGTSTSRAGYARNDSSWCSMVSPATRSTTPATSSTGTDSRRMRLTIGSFIRSAHTSDATATTDASRAMVTVTPLMPTR